MDTVYTIEKKAEEQSKDFVNLNNQNYGTNNNNNKQIDESHKPSSNKKLTSRSIVAQTLACFGKYMVMLNVGITASYPMIALPLLQQGSESIQISKEEASWLVSAMFIMMPFGCLISILQIRWGRKISMISTQILAEISWIILYFANDFRTLLVARALAGIGMTVNQPQVAAYIGEVTDPRLRGALGNACQTMSFVGAIIISLMVPLHSWKKAALICSVFPIIAVLYLCFIPESPVWLVKKQKLKEGLEALKWLRGWTSAKAVENEFAKIKEYCENEEEKALKKCNSNPAFEDEESVSNLPNYSNQDSLNAISNSEKQKMSKNADVTSFVRYVFKPEMYKPICMMSVCAFYTTGIGASSAYLYDLLAHYSSTFNFNTISLIVTVSMFVGNLMSIFLVSVMKKRPIILISMTSSFLGYGGLALFYIYRAEVPLWLIVLFLAWVFFVEGFGLQSLINSLMSEVFPLRGKIFGAAVFGTLITTFAFISSKTYLQLLSEVGVDVTLFIYSCLFLLGTIYFYFFFVETEGKTLAEIEESFKLS